MAMLDTVGWKAFRLGNLFNIVRGTSRTMRMLDEGDIPVIAAARADQGVAGCYDVKPEYQDAITISCNGVGCGSVFYHDGPFAITGDASVMQEKQQMSRAIKLFIAAVCDSLFSVKYSYAEKCNPVGLAEEMISLPATPDGQPDWAYMDASSLTAEAVADGHPLDTSAWKAFRIGELFEKLSLGFKAGRKFDKALDVSTEPSDEFDLPLVNAKDGNNGVMYWGRSMDWDSAEMTLDIVMDGAVSAGNVYAQPQSTGVLYNAYLIKPFCVMSANCLQFVATVMQLAIKEQFGYMNKCTWDRVSGLFIYLPVTYDGQPDWAWMEQYMQRQMNKAAALVEHLDAVWN